MDQALSLQSLWAALFKGNPEPELFTEKKKNQQPPTSTDFIRGLPTKGGPSS
jgi:hypothetical protein